jgi:hypothetical protein
MLEEPASAIPSFHHERGGRLNTISFVRYLELGLRYDVAG